MVGVALGLVVIPDGGLLAVGVPRMLAVLQESVKHRLMLPLIIRASKHQGVLHPDAHARQMEPGVNERLSEVQALGVRMEDVCRAALFERVSHALECREQEGIELIVLHGIVLYGKTAGTLEGHAIRRIGHDEVGFLAVHQLRYVLCGCGVTAHETVPSDRPDIPAFHEGCLLKRSGKVKVVILCPGVIFILKQVGQFFLVKAREQYIKISAL